MDSIGVLLAVLSICSRIEGTAFRIFEHLVDTKELAVLTKVLDE